MFMTIIPATEPPRQLLKLAVSTVPGNWWRVPWEERTIQIDGVADFSVQAETSVLLSGCEPLSFLIPAFLKSLRCYRVDSKFTLPDDPGSGFRRLFRDTIRDARGRVASLHSVAVKHEAVKQLAGYGLQLDMSSRRPVTSSLNPAAYAFCLTRKLGASS